MAQTIQLKRSAQSGKVPDTGSLNLGELAINTYDGKIYFKKSGSIESVESVLTTNSTVTGSIRLEGTGSFGSLKVNDTLTVNHGETIISGSALVTSDLTILGAVNAKQFNISVISSSVLFESGSSRFGNTQDDTHQFTGSVSVTGSITAISFIGNGAGITGVTASIRPDDFDFNSEPFAGTIGYIADSGSNYTIRATSSSVNILGGVTPFITITSQSFSTNTTFTASLQQGYTLVGNSSGVSYAVATSSFGGALPSGVVSGSSQLTSSVLATTGSNSFIGNQNISGTIYLTGSIIPSGSFVYDLGSETNSFRDLFLSTGSIRFHNPDGTEQGRITVDARSGDISLLKTAGLTNEQKATIGQGNINPDFLSAVSASNLFVQNKIVMPIGGTVNGINLTAFSSSIASTILNQNTATSSYETKGRGIVSSSAQTIANLPTGTVSGSSQIDSILSSLNTYTGSNDTTNTIQNIRLTTIESVTGSYETKGRGIVSGSSQLTSSYDTRYVASGSITQTTWDNIASKPGGIVSGSSQVLGGTGIISSSAQLENATITNLTITNLTVVNETASVIFSSGSNRFGDFSNDTHSFTGSVQISGSTTITGSVNVTGSLLVNGVAVLATTSSRAEQNFTATAAQTTFTVTGGYTVGLVDVYVNGIRYLPTDYTATNGTTVVLGIGLLAGDTVTILNYTSTIVALPTSRNVQDFTATAAQTTFTVTNGYIVGLLDIYVNGSKLSSSEFTATNGTTFVLTVASTVGDQVQSINYTASVNGISGAGTINELAYFTASGTIASLPVATYPSLTELSYVKGVTSAIQTQLNAKQSTITLTTTGTSGAATFSSNTLNIPQYAAALSGTTNYVAKFTSTTEIGNSSIFDNGTNVGIGTITPNVFLEISKNQNNSTIARISNTTSGTGGYSALNILSSNHIYLYNFSNAYTTSGKFAAGIFLMDINTINGININVTPASPIIFSTTDIERMRITSDGAMYMSRVNSNLTFTDSTGGIYVRQNGNYDNTQEELRIFGRNIGFFSHSGSRYATITSASNFGIGTSFPNVKLVVSNGGAVGFEVNPISGGADVFVYNRSTSAYAYMNFDGSELRFSAGGAEKMRLHGNGNLAINTTADNGYKLYVAGTIYATGNITANSDLSLKKNLELITNPTDKLMQLNGYSYQWKSDDSHQYGVIAQEVEKILPYAVSTCTDGIKGVSYNQIIPVLIEAVKEQQSQIEELKTLLKA